MPAGRVYRTEREQAVRQTLDTQYVVQIGQSAALSVTRRALAAVIRAWREHRSVQPVVRRELSELRGIMVDAMVFARLRGMQRAAKESKIKGAAVALAQSESYKRAIRFLRQRLFLSPTELAELEAVMDRHVLRVLAGVGDDVERRLMKTITEITQKNLHVRDGIKALRAEWGKLGLTESNRYQLENIFRTQTQLAYAAGRGDYERQPEVQEILWGYKYVTVGDDRVRPEHLAIDGVTLPKEDPFWRKNTPPNGWACLLPGTIIQGAILGASKAFYSGPAIEIETESGHRLAVTANHPICGSDGFVAAQDVNECDDLWQYSIDDELSVLRAVAQQHGPSSAEEVFDALRVERLPSFEFRGRASMLDFHGEAARFNGDVHVVGSYGELGLWRESDLAKSVDERDFSRAYSEHALVAGLGSLYAGCDCDWTPLGCSPGSGALALDESSIGLYPRPLDPLLFGRASQFDVGVHQKSSDCGSRHAMFLRKLVDAGAGAIRRDKVIRIRRFPFAGHVYDLHSTTGWILANGIVTSNCRCQVIPLYEPRRIVSAPTSATVDGKRIIPGAEPGFQNNPATLLN